jgi:hypothetical protein
MTTEPQYQVLYVKDGEETLTEPEDNKSAQTSAQHLDSQGYHVLSVMTVVGAKRYMAEKARRAEESGKSPFFPIRQYQKANRDVEAEVDDSLETGHQRTRRSADRRLAVDYALRLDVRKSRTAEELVADARTILEFLEG